jgi:hypothetical protein
LGHALYKTIQFALLICYLLEDPSEGGFVLITVRLHLTPRYSCLFKLGLQIACGFEQIRLLSL